MVSVIMAAKDEISMSHLFRLEKGWSRAPFHVGQEHIQVENPLPDFHDVAEFAHPPEGDFPFLKVATVNVADQCRSRLH